jgi:CBS-domain-containing membrane protein
LVQARAVSEVSRDEWSSTSLREIMQPMSIEEAVEVDDDATTALDRLTRASVDALPVRNRENQIVGSILQRDIARWLWLSQGEETAQR